MYRLPNILDIIPGFAIATSFSVTFFLMSQLPKLIFAFLNTPDISVRKNILLSWRVFFVDQRGLFYTCSPNSELCFYSRGMVFLQKLIHDATFAPGLFRKRTVCVCVQNRLSLDTCSYYDRWWLGDGSSFRRVRWE